jgi:hypothetical protein
MCLVDILGSGCELVVSWSKSTRSLTREYGEGVDERLLPFLGTSFLFH